MRKDHSIKITMLMGLLFLVDNALALEGGGGDLPGATLPDQVSKTLTKEHNFAPTQILPPVVSQPKSAAANQLGDQAKKVKFKLNGVILEGNRTYSSAQLKTLYAHDINKTITVEELFNIVQEITNFYRNNGFILSRAILPPQKVKNGLVHIQIIEGYIGSVGVSGTPHGARYLVQQFGNEIIADRPLQIGNMEKNLLLANEIPGTQVKAVLEPSKTKTGAADLTLLTENRPLSGYISYDNYGTRYIGPQQITGNIGMNSFAVSGDAANFTVTKTPKGGELNYNDINYSLPLNAKGTRLLVGGTRAHTHPLYILREVQIDGLNNNYYATVTYPWVRKRSESLTLRTGFTYLDSEVTILDTPLYSDHVRSLDLGGTYNFVDRWLGSNLISADFRQGLPFLGYTSNQNPDTAETSRPGGRGDYTKIMATASRLQAIKGAFSLYATAMGQWAFNPVLASEQFSFGGSQLGRGFDVAEIIGDKGLAGSLELRYDLGIGRYYLQGLQLYTFYDAGRVWNFKSIGGRATVSSATSAGFGTRFYFTKYVSGNLMWTKPLTNKVAAEEIMGLGTRPRAFFSIIASV